MSKWILLLTSVFFIFGCGRENRRDQGEAQAFIDSLSSILEPLQTRTMRLFWEATYTGADSLFKEYAEYEKRLMQVYNNPVAFQQIKDLSSKKIRNSLLAREVEVVYNEFLINQSDSVTQTQISELFGELYMIFQNQVYKENDEIIPVSELRRIIHESNDSVEREKAWRMLKQIGPEIENKFLQVVNLLNKSARSLGFKNYYEQKLSTQEENPRIIERLVQNYADSTAELYRLVKMKIDSVLAVKYKIEPADLQAWHYPDPFDSYAPFGQSIDIDQFYKDKNIIEIARRFYNGIGFDVDEIIERSDLAAHPNKYRQSYCVDISRNGDIRIMANIDNNARGMSVLMHELGHAVHYMNLNRDLPYYLLDLPTPCNLPRNEIYVNKELPYLLRDNTHFFIAEGVATLFQNLTVNPNWMEQMLELTAEQKAEYIRQMQAVYPAKQLYLSGWMLVMFNFEKALYENPEQDLNKLWWDLVEKYQLIRRPQGRNEPDWACNFHLVILPLYYQNYLLGNVFSAQLLHAMAIDQGLRSANDLQFVNNKALGNFLKDRVLSTGKKSRWDELIKSATGEELNVKYYIQQIYY